MFDLDLRGEALRDVPVIEPWKTVHLDPEYAGEWVVLGDVDGDGEVEIVSARNVDRDDVRYTSAVVAHKLDGSVLWRWGGPESATSGWAISTATGRLTSRSTPARRCTCSGT